MPCYLVQTVTIALTAADQTLLKQAATRLGWTVTLNDQTLVITTTSGEQISVNGTHATIREGQESLLASLTTAYAQEMLTTIACQYGWTLEATNPAQTEFVLQHY